MNSTIPPPLRRRRRRRRSDDDELHKLDTLKEEARLDLTHNYYPNKRDSINNPMFNLL